jgi:hypothetical protein
MAGIQYIQTCVVRCTLYKQILQYSLLRVIKKETTYICSILGDLIVLRMSKYTPFDWRPKMFSNPKRFPTKNNNSTNKQTKIYKREIPLKPSVRPIKQNKIHNFNSNCFALWEQSLVYGVSDGLSPVRQTIVTYCETFYPRRQTFNREWFINSFVA